MTVSNRAELTESLFKRVVDLVTMTNLLDDQDPSVRSKLSETHEKIKEIDELIEKMPPSVSAEQALSWAQFRSSVSQIKSAVKDYETRLTEVGK